MGAIAINPAQLAELEGLRDRNAPAAEIWSTLDRYGDSYAHSALQVIKDPGSMPWLTVQAAWAVTGADFSKFNEVANQHAKNYINAIANDYDPKTQMYKLPTTNIIESSYVQALDKYSISPYTAIDVNIEKMIHDHSSISPPHWYNTPGVLMIERERIKPSDPSIFKGVDSAKAREVWLETGAGMAANMVLTSHDNLQHSADAYQMWSWLGGKSFNTQTLAGVSCYVNGKTGNWAFFNPNHEGTASIDGQLTPITKDNWRQNQDGHFEIRMKDGQWKTANVEPVLQEKGQETTRWAGVSDETVGRDAHASQRTASNQGDASQTPQGPFGDAYADRYFAALLSGDSAAMDRIAVEFSQTPQGQQLAQSGDQALAQQQSQQQQQDQSNQSQQAPSVRMSL